MKVALLSRSAEPLHAPGGLERAVFEQARHLQRRGVETVLFTRPATEPASFPGRVESVPYGRLTGLRHGRVLDRALLYPPFARRMGRAVAAAVRRGEVDVVDAQGLTALGYGRERGRDPRLRAPLVMNPQGMEEHKAGGLRALLLARLRRLSREAAARADRVVATDEAMRDEVPRLLGIAPERVVVLPNAVDLEALSAATPEDPVGFLRDRVPALAGRRPLLLSVARLEPYKGLDDVAEALATLDADGALPAGWAWAIAGEGPQRRDLEKRLRPWLGAAPPCAFLLGRVGPPLLHALYAAADLFVHATRFEGSSLVTLEAMAHGRAVVATRAGGIPDKVLDGRTGRLVEPADASGLARALGELLASPERRHALGAAGRLRVEEHFSWPRRADRLLALYEELLGEGRGR